MDALPQTGLRVISLIYPGLDSCYRSPLLGRACASLSCAIDTNFLAADNWSFREAGQRFHVKMNGRFLANTALAVRETLLAGQGIGLCPTCTAGEESQTGRQNVILDLRCSTTAFTVYAHNAHLAAKVLTFVDNLVRRFGASPERDVAQSYPRFQSPMPALKMCK